MHLFGEVHTSPYLNIIEQAESISFGSVSCGAGMYTVDVVKESAVLVYGLTSAKNAIKDNLCGCNLW